MDEVPESAAPPSATERSVTEAVDAKGLGPRALAFLIDGAAVVAADVVSTPVGFSASAVILSLVLPGPPVGWEHGNPWPLAISLALALPFFYFLIFEWLYGATPGKVLLNMRVVRENGRPCGLRAAAVRGLLRYVDGLMSGLGLWLLMRKPPHRRLGDRAAGTLVVDDDSPLVAGRPSRRWFWAAAAIYFGLCCTINGMIFALALKFE